jgi:hypothetical protein
MNARVRRWLPPAIAAAVFALLSLAVLPYPGVQDDEVFFSYAIDTPGTAIFNAHAFGHTIPLMGLNYYGALKTWIYEVVFSLAPPSRCSVRLPMVIAGVLTVWLTWQWVRRIAGARAAAFTVALLATDATFILTNTLDWGPVALQHLFLMAGLLALQFWLERGAPRWLALAFFLWGLGLWDKALMIWPLVGLAVAAACVYPRELWRVLGAKSAAIAAAAFIVGALPLIGYNIARHGDTAVANTQLSLNALPHNFDVLQTVFRGDSLFGIVVAGAPGPVRREPATFVERLSTGIHEHFGSHTTRPFLLGLALSAIAWLFLVRQREGRLLAFVALASAIAWLQMAANTGTGGSAHHVILIWPFPCAFIGIALAGASSRLPKRAGWAVTALVAWFTVANILNTNEYLARLIRNGAPAGWTDASERLAGAVSHYRNDPIVTVDWGYINGLRMFYGGALHLVPIDDGNRDKIASAIGQPRAVFIRHTDDHQILPGVNENFRGIAASLGYSENILRVVHDDEGRAIFEIFRLSKTR